MENNIEELKNVNGETIGTISGRRITFSDGNTAVIRNGKVYSNHKEIGSVGESIRVSGGMVYKPKSKTKLRRIVLATGVATCLLIGMLLKNKTSDGSKTIIIPTPTPTKTIEMEEPTITVTPTGSITRNIYECDVKLVSYTAKPGDSLTAIVSMFYGEAIDKYCEDGYASKDKIIYEMTQKLGKINDIKDIDKISPGDIDIFNPDDVKENSSIIFYKYATYERDGDIIKFQMNHRYEDSDETLDGMTDVDLSGSFFDANPFTQLTDDGYFITNSLVYVMEENFDIDEFIKRIYAPVLKNYASNESTLNEWYSHIKEIIYRLNPSMGGKDTKGKKIVIVDPRSIKADTYLFVTIEYPNMTNDGNLSFYVQNLIQEANKQKY